MQVLYVGFVNRNVKLLKTYRNIRDNNILQIWNLSVMNVSNYSTVEINLRNMRKRMKNLNVKMVTIDKCHVTFLEGHNLPP